MINSNMASTPAAGSVQQIVQPTQVIQQPTEPAVITQPSVPVKVDTQSQVVNTPDDDFDDFFE